MNQRMGQIAPVLFAALGASYAHGQTITPAAAPGTDSTLPEITVQDQAVSAVKTDTASSRKFTAPLLDTPKSVTVIPHEVLQQTNATTLVDALRTVPGITFGAGEGGNPTADRPFIRGFDAQSSTYVDGMRDLGSQSRETFDVESIEVIKGPSSTYGGGGSTGGSINIISKAPLKENYSAASFGVGTDNYRRVTVDGNYLLNDNTAVRLNAMYHDADIADRNGPNNNRWGFAPAITWGLSGDTSVTASYYHLETNDLPDSGIPYNRITTADPRNGNGRPWGNVGQETFYGLNDRDFRKTTVDTGTLKFRHDFNSVTHLTNTLRYSRSTNNYILTQPDDSKGNTFNGLVWRRANSRASSDTSVQNQTQLDGIFKTGELKHTYAVGVELSQESVITDSYLVNTNTGSTAGANICPTNGTSTSFNCTSLTSPNPDDPWNGSIVRANRPKSGTNITSSAYAFDNIDLTPSWALNLGIRFDHFRTALSQSAYPAISAAASPTGSAIAAVAPTNIHATSNFFNYLAGAVYKPTVNSSIYASYSTSSDPSGLNALDGTSDGTLSAANQSLQPERSKSYELGTKWDLLDNNLSLTGAIFRTKKSNARVTAADGTTQLAGDYRVDGLELGASGNITSKWSAFGGYTYLNSLTIDGGSATGGTAASPATAGSTATGHQFANIPKHSFSLWSAYRITPKLTVGGGLYMMSKVYGNTANTLWVPGYTRYDAMATYAINKKMNVQLNVQNLTNKFYFNQAYAAHFASVAEGRVATLTLNVKF